MRILLAVDSRVANVGGIALLDLADRGRSEFFCHTCDEDFKRKGLRGFAMNGDMMYVVNSAALYFFKIDTSGNGGPLATHIRTVRRPEWEIGERCAADLHHVHYSPSRDRIFIANSFMDCIDEVSTDGQWLGRKYLWDISPAVAEYARERNFGAADCVHCNYICEYERRLYLTLGNINGTRRGAVVCYETGEIVAQGLDFPHDGEIVDGCAYITNTATSVLNVYNNVGAGHLRNRAPDHTVPIKLSQEEWSSQHQWIRGIAVSDKYVIVGSSKFRVDRPEQGVHIAPPRLIFLDKATLAHVADVFLPAWQNCPTPCVYSLHIVSDGDVTFEDWPAPTETPRAGEAGATPKRGATVSPQTLLSDEAVRELLNAPPPAGKKRVLHVLAYSLPKANGYTMRSRYIVDTQKEQGQYEPIVATSPFYPRSFSPRHALINNVLYCRVPHPIDASGKLSWADRVARKIRHRKNLRIDRNRQRAAMRAASEEAADPEPTATHVDMSPQDPWRGHPAASPEGHRRQGPQRPAPDTNVLQDLGTPVTLPVRDEVDGPDVPVAPCNDLEPAAEMSAVAPETTGRLRWLWRGVVRRMTRFRRWLTRGARGLGRAMIRFTRRMGRGSIRLARRMRRGLIHLARALGRWLIRCARQAHRLVASAGRKVRGLERQAFRSVHRQWAHRQRGMSRTMWNRLDRVEDYLLTKRLEGHLTALCRQARPDIIHAHTPYRCGLPASRVARKFGIPFVYEVRGLWEDSSVASGRFTPGDKDYNEWRDKETLVMRSADMLICICQSLRDDIVSRGIDPSRVSIVPNGVCAKSFDGSAKEQLSDVAGPAVENVRRRLASHTVGYVGSLRALEGVDELVRGFAHLHQQDPDTSLLIVGAGSDLAALKELAAELGVQDHVVFTGWVPHEQIHFYYDMIDIFAVTRPDLRVTRLVTPLKPIEAMAMRIPLVVSDLPALREIVSDGETGLVYKAGAPESLAAKCLQLIRDEGRRNRMAEAAMEWARRHRTWSDIVQKVPAVYEAAREHRAQR